MLVVAARPTMALSRVGIAPYTVNEADGAPANAAVIGRAVLAYSCCQPSRRLKPNELIYAPSSAPSTVRSDVVVCCATLRLSELAPDSVKAFCVVLLV